MKKTTNVLPLNVQTDTLYGRQTHGRFSSNQDILKLILNINFGLISSMMHKIFASLAYRRVRGQVKYEHLHSAKDSKKLTGMMKLVSGGSCTVNSSIHVSRSEVGWAVNLVLSSKNRTNQNQWTPNPYCFLNPFLLQTRLKKCIRMWLSLADERGVAIFDPMSSKMHWICNDWNKHVKYIINIWVAQMAFRM